MVGNYTVKPAPERSDQFVGQPRGFVPHIGPWQVGPGTEQVINAGAWKELMVYANRLG